MMRAFWSVKEAGGKRPIDRKRSLDASMFIPAQQTMPHMKADILSKDIGLEGGQVAIFPY